MKLFFKRNGSYEVFKLFIKFLLHKFGYDITPFVDTSKFPNDQCKFGYKENKEVGAVNLSEKIKRVKEGKPFELPEMVAVNCAVAKYFINGAKKIVNIGAGTATFEWYASEYLGNVQFIASEFDEDCHNWCKNNRPRTNVTYCTDSATDLFKKYGKFDLLVCFDVIEHIYDYAGFLKDVITLSDRAVFSTTNKARSLEALHASPPMYYQHVREWTAGEFYWVLRMFYPKVTLFTVTNDKTFEIKEIGLLSTDLSLIALCEKS